MEPLMEPLTESLNGASLPGAAEQGSRGAEEQQRPPRESLTELPPRTDQAAALILDATGATPELAVEAALTIARERKHRNLPGLVQRIIQAGELGQWMPKAEAALRKQAVAAAQAEARASPPCPHGEPGGNHLHPTSRKPFCPLCRKGTTP